MRDLFVFFGFLAMVPFVLGRPHVGILLWAWTALLVPNAYVYGFAQAIQFNLISAAVTLLAWLLSWESHLIRANRTNTLFGLYFLWGTASAALTIGDPSATWALWEEFAKMLLFAVAVGAIIKTHDRFNALVFAIVLSLGFHGGVEGLKFLASGGGHRIVGPGTSIIADNNQFALAMLCTVPLALYLFRELTSPMLRIGFLGVGALLFFTVVGTFSRGGFIGISALLLWSFLHTPKKIRYLLAVAPLCLALTIAAPKEWVQRMDTIGEADQDASFMGRVIAWKQSALIALDHPIFGGGFHSVQNYKVWNFYRDNRFQELSFIPTENPAPGTGRAAHSIYFEVLGDMGFGGLIIFFALSITAFHNARIIIRKTKSVRNFAWAGRLARSIEYSLIVYFISGAALSMAYFELIFVLFSMLATLRQIVDGGLIEKAPFIVCKK